jgi:hypothetical protein
MRGAAVLWGILGVCSSVGAQTGTTVDTLMQKSGIYEQIGYFPEHVKMGFLQTQQQDDALPDDEALAIAGMIDQSFDPEALRSEIRQNITKGLTDQEMQQVIDWLDSPLGQKITALEKAAASTESYDRMLSQQSEIFQQPQERKDLARQLDEAVKMTDLTLSITENTQLAMFAIFMELTPEDQRVPMGQVAAALKQDLLQYRDAAQEKTLGSILFTYADLTDAELGAYVDFARSTIGQTYHATVNDAFTIALAKGSRQLAQALNGYFLQRTPMTSEEDL